MGDSSRGRLPQTAGSPNLKGGGAAAVVPPKEEEDVMNCTYLVLSAAVAIRRGLNRSSTTARLGQLCVNTDTTKQTVQ